MSDMIRFSGKNVLVTEVAKIIGKDQSFVRQAIIEGMLPIGIAFRKEGSSNYDFYISPKLLYDYTGLIILLINLIVCYNNIYKYLSDEGKQEVYNFAITLKDSSNVFAPISEEQMKSDLKKSEEQIKQRDFKPYKECLTGMRKELAF